MAAENVPTPISATELRQFEIPGARAKGKTLGRGAYGTVEEYDINGVTCAGKRIYDVLVQSESRDVVRCYVEECKLMAKLRHPNIVQFLGVCFPTESAALPVLIMERLTTDLDSLLENTPNIPLSLRMSFLTDVARGLAYLHGHRPPVIHRDLSARNVLLNSSLVAKISDLGNSRIVNLSPEEVARLSKTPGCPVYMPPEMSESKPYYGPSLDVFSFGHLGLFAATQVFPGDLLPYTYPVSTNSRHLIARTEVQRRERYFTQLHQKLGEDHNLGKVIIECLDNNPHQRPTADQLVSRLEEMSLEIQITQDHTVKLQLMRQLRQIEDSEWRQELLSVNTDRVLLQEKNTDLVREKEELMREKEVIQSQLRAKGRELEERERENDTLSAERKIRQFQLKERDKSVEQAHSEQSVTRQFKEKNNGLVRRKEELLRERETPQSLLKSNGRESQERERDSDSLSVKRRMLEFQPREKDDSIKSKLFEELKEIQQSKEKSTELVKEEGKLLRENEAILSQMSTKGKEAEDRERENNTLSADRKLLQSLLRERDDKIKQLHQELRDIQQYKSQSLVDPTNTLNLNIRQCADIPLATCNAQAVVIRNKVYVGGGLSSKYEGCNDIFIYDIRRNSWSSNECSTSWSALASYNDRLVLAGGKASGHVTDQLWVLGEDDQWQQPIPPMPTPRKQASAVGYGQHLIVAGGVRKKALATVEVYDGLKWMEADSMPNGYSMMKTTVLNGTWYLTGGHFNHVSFKQKLVATVGGYGERPIDCDSTVLSVSLQSLTERATSPQRDGPSPWNKLKDAPNKLMAVATTGGGLVVFGGYSMIMLRNKSYVFMYFPPTKSWESIGELPYHIHSTCTVALPSGEVMVIGGALSPSVEVSNTVYTVKVWD